MIDRFAMHRRRKFVFVGVIATAMLALVAIYGTPVLRRWSVERSWAEHGATVTCNEHGEVETLVAHFAPAEFDRSSLKNIRGSQSLEVLVLMYSPVTDDDMQYLQDLPQLRSLAINGTRVTDRGVAEIVGLLPTYRYWFASPAAKPIGS